MASIHFMRGNLIADRADVLVNTVNCVGVMGAGLAKAFATAFPYIVAPYQAACKAGQIIPGTAMLFPLGDGRLWAALATKNHWRNPSQLEWVRAGLYDLADRARQADARSIAIGRPGCGLGGLDWDLVRPVLVAALSDFDVTVYQ